MKKSLRRLLIIGWRLVFFGGTSLVFVPLTALVGFVQHLWVHRAPIAAAVEAVQYAANCWWCIFTSIFDVEGD